MVGEALHLLLLLAQVLLLEACRTPLAIIRNQWRHHVDDLGAVAVAQSDGSIRGEIVVVHDHRSGDLRLSVIVMVIGGVICEVMGEDVEMVVLQPPPLHM